MSNDTFHISFKVVKPMPVKEINNWEDKVVFGIARETLDFTNTKQHFPHLSGTLQLASMSAGVKTLGKGIYGLGYDKEYGGENVSYGKDVWKKGPGTNWTNKRTLPQWYKSVYEKYRNEINQIALKNAEGELK